MIFGDLRCVCVSAPPSQAQVNNRVPLHTKKQNYVTFPLITIPSFSLSLARLVTLLLSFSHTKQTKMFGIVR